MKTKSKLSKGLSKQEKTKRHKEALVYANARKDVKMPNNKGIATISCMSGDDKDE